MQLQTLLPETPLDPALAALNIKAVRLDSRQVAPGDAFFALPGTQVDGASFAMTAADHGASVVIAASDASIPEPLACPLVRVEDPARALALAAAAAAGPQPKTVIGVTGTAGKSSVVHFLRQIWQANGRQAASIGTLGVTSADDVRSGGLTTPDAVSLHEKLAALARQGIDAAALEASSHGISQRRLDGVRFQAVAFTNLGRDHLDYHPTEAAYFAAKMRLFETLASPGTPAIIDADGATAERVIKIAKAANLKPITVGEGGSDLQLVERRRGLTGQQLTLVYQGSAYAVNLPLLGDFQASNALVALGLALATGCDAATSFNALSGLAGTPGRMELIGTTSEGASVFVDYAHKPDALKAVLTTLRPFTKGRLISLFGCGGDRDPGKRAMMGHISAELADITIVTDDNPRTENRAAIRQAILSAAPHAREVEDRGEAIDGAIRALAAGDVLVIAGKGHEEGQIIGKEVLPFSDQAVARKALTSHGMLP